METERQLAIPGTNLILSGPDYVGKKSFVCSLMEGVVGHQDLLVAEVGPDGAREARDFLSSLPVLGPFRAVVLDEAERLSEPAQDAWLKLVEETPGRSSIVLVCSDVDRLLPPLRSRLPSPVRWRRLTDAEVEESVRATGAEPDPVAVRLCRGLPGLYEVVRLGAFSALREAVLSHIDGEADPLFASTPAVVKELKSGRSPERDAVSLVVRRAALERLGDPARLPAVRSFLRFAGDIVRVPSVNADISWQRACIVR